MLSSFTQVGCSISVPVLPPLPSHPRMWYQHPNPVPFASGQAGPSRVQGTPRATEVVPLQRLVTSIDGEGSLGSCSGPGSVWQCWTGQCSPWPAPRWPSSAAGWGPAGARPVLQPGQCCLCLFGLLDNFESRSWKSWQLNSLFFPTCTRRCLKPQCLTGAGGEMLEPQPCYACSQQQPAALPWPWPSPAMHWPNPCTELCLPPLVPSLLPEKAPEQ